MAVAYTIETCKVGAGLSRRHQIVGGYGVFGVRQGDGLDRAARSLERCNSLFDGGANFGIETFTKILGRNANAQPRDRLVAFSSVVRDRSRRTRSVTRVVTG